MGEATKTTNLTTVDEKVASEICSNGTATCWHGTISKQLLHSDGSSSTSQIMVEVKNLLDLISKYKK